MKHFEDLHLKEALHPKHVHYNFNILLSSPMLSSEHAKIKTSCKHIDNITKCTIVTLQVFNVPPPLSNTLHNYYESKASHTCKKRTKGIEICE
jgi:hypothetical protein